VFASTARDGLRLSCDSPISGLYHHTYAVWDAVWNARSQNRRVTSPHCHDRQGRTHHISGQISRGATILICDG
jgi:hypothetical protein